MQVRQDERVTDRRVHNFIVASECYEVMNLLMRRSPR
jgi:hypothetical protein